MLRCRRPLPHTLVLVLLLLRCLVVVLLLLRCRLPLHHTHTVRRNKNNKRSGQKCRRALLVIKALCRPCYGSIQSLLRLYEGSIKGVVRH